MKSIVFLLFIIMMSNIVMAEERKDLLGDLPPEKPVPIGDNGLPNLFPGSSGVSSGTVTNRGESIDISEANSYNAPNKAQKVSNSGKMSLDKKGNIKTIDSAGELQSPDISAIGVENIDLEAGTISQAAEISDDTGFTLDNSEHVFIQKQTITSDVETTQGDYYIIRQQTVITAKKADLNTPYKIYSQNTNNLYYNGQILTFDRTDSLVLPPTKTTFTDLGQTQILFKGNNPAQITTTFTTGTATIPNPLSSNNYFTVRKPTFQTIMLHIKTDTNGNKIEEERTFDDLKEFVKYLFVNTQTFVVNGENIILKNIKEAMLQQKDDSPLFSLTQTGYDNCLDCVMTFKGKPDGKVVMKFDKINEGKVTYEIPAGMNITFGNNAPNVENPEISLIISAFNTSIITIEKSGKDTVIESSNTEIIRDYGLAEEIARCRTSSMQFDEDLKLKKLIFTSKPCIYIYHMKDRPSSHINDSRFGKQDFVKANETLASTFALYKTNDGIFEIYKYPYYLSNLSTSMEHAWIDTSNHTIGVTGRIDYYRPGIQISDQILTLDGIEYTSVHVFDPLLTKIFGSYDQKNNIHMDLDNNNLKTSIRLSNPSIQCNTNRTIFDTYSGPYYTKEDCRTTSPVLYGAKNVQKITQRNIPQRIHNTQYEIKKPAFIIDYESFYGIKTKRMQYVDDAILSFGKSEFGNDGTLFFACKTCTKAREKIADERKKYVDSKGCAVP